MMVDWALDYQLRKQLEIILLNMITDKQYKTATVIAPGRKWKEFVEKLSNTIKVEAVYDKDPQFSDWCTTGDPIFDDVKITSDVVITLHGEKLYPPTRMFFGTDHILVVAPHYNLLDCTKEESLEWEEDNLDVYGHGDFLIYYGTV